MKDLVTNELSTLMEESLYSLLRQWPHSTQCGIRSVVYNILDQVMLDLLGKDVIRDTLGAHIAKLFDTDAAANRL